MGVNVRIGVEGRPCFMGPMIGEKAGDEERGGDGGLCARINLKIHRMNSYAQ